MTNFKNSCIAIGNFDGIHIGHDALIREMLEISKYNNLNSMILTFKFSDKTMNKSSANMKYITNFDSKMSLLQAYKPTNVCYIDLDSEISKYSSEMFIKNILIDKYDMKHIVVGYNFRFGHYALGNTDTLKKFSNIYGYDVSILPRIRTDDRLDISSTIIRDFIKKGKIKEANRLLTQNYTIFTNEVEHLDNNRCIVNQNSDIITPCDGKYKVLIGENECIAEINTIDHNKIFKFNCDFSKQDIVFLSDKWLFKIIINLKFNKKKIIFTNIKYCVKIYEVP